MSAAAFHECRHSQGTLSFLSRHNYTAFRAITPQGIFLTSYSTMAAPRAVIAGKKKREEKVVNLQYDLP